MSVSVKEQKALFSNCIDNYMMMYVRELRSKEPNLINAEFYLKQHNAFSYHLKVIEKSKNKTHGKK